MTWIVVATVVFLAGAAIGARRRIVETFQEIEDLTEEKDACDFCSGRKKSKKGCPDHGSGWNVDWDAEDTFYVLRGAVFWLPFALSWLFWKALFPRGVRTPKSIAKEREAKLNQRNALIDSKDQLLLQHRAALIEAHKALDIPIPEGL